MKTKAKPKKIDASIRHSIAECAIKAIDTYLSDEKSVNKILDKLDIGDIADYVLEKDETVFALEDWSDCVPEEMIREYINTHAHLIDFENVSITYLQIDTIKNRFDLFDDKEARQYSHEVHG